MARFAFLPDSIRRVAAGLSYRFRGSWHVLPDFLIVGPPKCGTTSVYAYLQQHPHVASALRKEVLFFDRNYQRGVHWYRTMFPSILQKQFAIHIQRRPFVTGECTPYCLQHAHAPQRVRETIPNAKLIAILRNPIDRAYSHYQHNVRSGRESLTFEAALDAESTRIADLYDPDPFVWQQGFHYMYKEGGFYAKFLQRWYQHFPKQQLFIASFEELVCHTNEIYHRLLDFLGLQRWSPPSFEVHNRGSHRSDVGKECRARLRKFFEPHNASLFAMLGREFEWS